MPVRFALIACTLVLVLIAVNLLIEVPPSQNASVRQGAPTGMVDIGGSFTLTSHEGKPIHDTDFQGKLLLVYFGFTYCPDVCPAGLGIISQALKEVNSDDIIPLFITVDPQRDTVSQMATYVTHFHPSLIGATGTQEQIDKVLKEYRVYAKKVQRENMSDYTMDHSAFTYLMGRNGQYLAHFGHNTPPEEMAAKIKAYL